MVCAASIVASDSGSPVREGLFYLRRTFYMKKFLYGMAAVCVSLIFLACPTDAGDVGDRGPQGAQGENTITLSSASVNAATLAQAFTGRNVVVLDSNVNNVEGVVPAESRLEVWGTTAVAGGKELEILAGGSVKVLSGATLDGSAASIKGAPNSVSGAGTLALLYSNATAEAAGYLTYKTVSFTGTKAVGGLLTEASITAIFNDPEGPDELTVNNLTVTAGAIPSGKTLTIAGAGSVAANLLLTGRGKLIVKENATLTVAANNLTITGNATDGIVVNGTLTLVAAVTGLTLAGVVDLADATLDASLVSGAVTLTFPAATVAAGIGAIELNSTYDLSLAGTALTGLTVGSITSEGAGVKSSVVKTFTVKGTSHSVGLATAADTFIVKSLAENTFTLKGATTIGSALTIAGDAKIAGSITVASTNFALTTANLGKLAANSSVTYTDAVAGTAASLVIPEYIAVTGTAATLSAITGLTVDGTLTVGNDATFGDVEALSVKGSLTAGSGATFAKAVTVTVDGTLTAGNGATFAKATTITVNGDLTVGTGLTLAEATAANITGSGSITAGAVTTATAVTKLIGSGVETVTLAVAAYTGAFTVPANTTRIFSANFAPDAGITVNGTLVLAGNLTLLNNAAIGTDGALALVSGKAITLGDASAKITGGSAYEIVYGGTAGGTLTAGGTDTAVVFKATAIEGYNDENLSLAEATTPDSAATLAFGVQDAVLTVKVATSLKGVILDVSSKGKITVADGATLTLALGAGDDHVGSGGIFTAAIASGTAGGAVKANAFKPKASDGALANAGEVGEAKVEKAVTAAAAGDLGTGDAAVEPAPGVITGAATTGTTIDAADTFTVTAGAITVVNV
jgi:hypothetical protein